MAERPTQTSAPDPGLKELQRSQYEFAAHLRDPRVTAAPTDIEDRRMDIYRRLFINNVSNFLKSTYRRTNELLGEDRWRSLTRDYYRDHVSKAALFPELPGEFLRYLMEERAEGQHTATEPDPPWLTELAHYEWVEAGLRFADDPEPVANLLTDGDLLQQCPVASELAWLLSYRYPVDKISAAEMPDEPATQPYCYIAWSNADFDVKFVSVNVVSARLFELVRDDPAKTGAEHLATIAAEMNHPQPEAIRESGLAILEQWRDKQILLGSLPPAD
jgi:hypothetical protein